MGQLFSINSTAHEILNRVRIQKPDGSVAFDEIDDQNNLFISNMDGTCRRIPVDFEEYNGVERKRQTATTDDREDSTRI